MDQEAHRHCGPSAAFRVPEHCPGMHPIHECHHILWKLPHGRISADLSLTLAGRDASPAPSRENDMCISDFHA
jgi:hypothetical protein